MISSRREEQLHRAFPWALGVGVFLASFVTPLHPPWEVASPDYTPSVANGFGIVVMALLSGAATTMARRRIWPVCIVGVLAWLAYSMWPAFIATSFYAAVRWKTRWHAVLYLVAATLLVVVPIGAGTKEGAVSGIRFAAFTVPFMVIIPYTAGLWVRTRGQLIDELRASNSRLAAQARAEERARIAREMHDVVAHRVAMIVLHAGGLEVGAQDEHTRQEAELIRTIGRTALDELRHVLGVLRELGEAPAPQPLRASLGQLVEQTREAGVPVELTIDGELTALPATVEKSVYRLAQEALTNVVKHAPGARAEVLLRKASGILDVTVRNGPPASLGAKQALQLKMNVVEAEPLPSSGLGLMGLRERVELLGGRFEAGALADGGFQVSARLPTNGNVLQLPGEDVRRAV